MARTSTGTDTARDTARDAARGSRRDAARSPMAPHRLHAAERRAQVIEAAVRAFASGGLAGTSTEDIARLAGVSQPYLFRLFGSKRDLFIASVERMFERIGSAFDEAARRPRTDVAGFDPVLASIARAYGDLLADQTLLRLQLHAYAACDDPVVRDVVRREFASLVSRVAELSGQPALALRDFFAAGTLMNVAAAMDLTEADIAWQVICEGGPA